MAREQDIFHLPYQILEDGPDLLLALNRNFKEVERMLSQLQMYEKQVGKPINELVTIGQPVWDEAGNIRDYIVEYGERKVFKQDEEPTPGTEAHEWDLWLKYEEGSPVWRQLRRTGEGVYEWIVVAHRGDIPAEHSVITTLGLDAAVITTGLLEAGRIQISEASTFASNYDPSSKETPDGAQEKADTAEADAKAHADKIADGAASGTFITGTSIISPIIAGANGYFSNKVTVGQNGPIVLDGEAKEIQLSDGARLVGANGVLSVFQFVSMEAPGYGPTQGWGDFGLVDLGGLMYKGRTGVRVFIPSNFVVTKATLTLEAMPVYYEDNMFEVYKWKQSRNLKLYQAGASDGFFHYIDNASASGMTWRDGTDRTSAVFGISSWSPSLAYSGSDIGNTQNKVQYRSGSVLSYLTAGQSRVFYVETTDAVNQTNYGSNQGLGRIVVVVEGYAKASTS